MLEDQVFSYMKQGPMGQPEACYRFRVTFKDTTTRRRGINFPTFSSWMGTIRELGIVRVGGNLVPDFESGRWGMVTNHSDIDVLGDAGCLDLIEGRMHISKVYGQFASSVDMHFAWVKIHEDGSEETIATSNMATTWVEITGHGLVEVKPFPAYLEEFIRSFLPNGSRLEGSTAQADCRPRREPRNLHRDAQSGACLYRAPKAPTIEPELMQQTFHTTSAESNLVGNIYFANYYHWQSRLIDGFFHGISPDWSTTGGSPGEFHCMHCEVKHLREAMPFDQIQVVMGLKGLYERGVHLHFDFYKRTDDGDRIKLAFGDWEAVWVIGAQGAEPCALPDRYLAALEPKRTARASVDLHLLQTR